MHGAGVTRHEVALTAVVRGGGLQDKDHVVFTAARIPPGIVDDLLNDRRYVGRVDAGAGEQLTIDAPVHPGARAGALAQMMGGALKRSAVGRFSADLKVQGLRVAVVGGRKAQVGPGDGRAAGNVRAAKAQTHTPIRAEVQNVSGQGNLAAADTLFGVVLCRVHTVCKGAQAGSAHLQKFEPLAVDQHLAGGFALLGIVAAGGDGGARGDHNAGVFIVVDKRHGIQDRPAGIGKAHQTHVDVVEFVEQLEERRLDLVQTVAATGQRTVHGIRRIDNEQDVGAGGGRIGAGKEDFRIVRPQRRRTPQRDQHRQGHRRQRAVHKLFTNVYKVRHGFTGAWERGV